MRRTALPSDGAAAARTAAATVSHRQASSTQRSAVHARAPPSVASILLAVYINEAQNVGCGRPNGTEARQRYIVNEATTLWTAFAPSTRAVPSSYGRLWVAQLRACIADARTKRPWQPFGTGQSLRSLPEPDSSRTGTST